MKSIIPINSYLLEIQKKVYEPANLFCNNIMCEKESQEYGACSFEMNNKIINFRVAKITPTKIGQFVTMWKRIDNGPIMPYDLSDALDFFVIATHNGKHFGQFVFPKNILYEKGFISKDGKGGKRAMRVYPSWDIADSFQAKKTQAWQLIYFFEIQNNIDIFKIQKLFS